MQPTSKHVTGVVKNSGVDAWSRRATQTIGYNSPRSEVMDGDVVTWVGGGPEGDVQRSHPTQMRDKIKNWSGKENFWFRVTRNLRPQINLRRIPDNADKSLGGLLQRRSQQLRDVYSD